MKFKVTVARKEVWMTQVIVEAWTEAEARELARDIANEKSDWNSVDIEEDWVEAIEEMK